MKQEGSGSAQAGGSLLAISIIAGTVVGVVLREPSMGFLIGTALGLLLLGLIWVRDRRR